MRVSVRPTAAPNLVLFRFKALSLVPLLINFVHLLYHLVHTHFTGNVALAEFCREGFQLAVLGSINSRGLVIKTLTLLAGLLLGAKSYAYFNQGCIAIAKKVGSRLFDRGCAGASTRALAFRGACGNWCSCFPVWGPCFRR